MSSLQLTNDSSASMVVYNQETQKPHTSFFTSVKKAVAPYASAAAHIVIDEAKPVITKHATKLATSALNALVPGAGTLVEILTPIAKKVIAKTIEAVSQAVHHAADHLLGDYENGHTSFVKKAWSKVSKWWSKSTPVSNDEESSAVVVYAPEDGNDNLMVVSNNTEPHSGVVIEELDTTMCNGNEEFAMVQVGEATYHVDVAAAA